MRKAYVDMSLEELVKLRNRYLDECKYLEWYIESLKKEIAQ